MSTSGVDHLGVAVASIEEAAELWQILGARLEAVEEVPSQKVRVGFLPLDNLRLELIEPLAPDSPVARHLERRGQGLHHLCIAVADLETTMQELKQQGIRLLSDTPQDGAEDSKICFIHPKSANGVLVELVQHGQPDG